MKTSFLKIFSSVNKLEKYQNHLIAIFLFLGLLIRFYFVDKYIDVSGDLLLYGEWGEKFWIVGSKDFYYLKDWYYASPNYPPIVLLLYAAAYWVYDHRYILAEIHNAIKIIPSSFIVYFGHIDPLNPLQHGVGYYMMLKLPAIISDLGISVVIYKVVFKLTNNWKRALAGLMFFLFNPITILLSAVWGQTDSLIALFALCSFLLLLKKRFSLSMLLFFISVYTKPNWVFLTPLYLFVLIKKKPKLIQFILGSMAVLIVFYITSAPFARGNIFEFAYFLSTEKLLATVPLIYIRSSDKLM